MLALTLLVGWAVAASTHSLPAALLGLFVPVVAQQVVKFMAARQRRAFSEQLPDNLAVLASAMRAGRCARFRAAARGAYEAARSTAFTRAIVTTVEVASTRGGTETIARLPAVRIEAARALAGVEAWVRKRLGA